ncbi:MAG: hypothetical protein ACQCN6_06145 [Candidatus Bathyarchaeia archaeon]
MGNLIKAYFACSIHKNVTLSLSACGGLLNQSATRIRRRQQNTIACPVRKKKMSKGCTLFVLN